MAATGGGRGLKAGCVNSAYFAHECAARSPQMALGGLFAALGLIAVALALSGDREWDESAARYRDSDQVFVEVVHRDIDKQSPGA